MFTNSRLERLLPYNTQLKPGFHENGPITYFVASWQFQYLQCCQQRPSVSESLKHALHVCVRFTVGFGFEENLTEDLHPNTRPVRSRSEYMYQLCGAHFDDFSA